LVAQLTSCPEQQRSAGGGNTIRDDDSIDRENPCAYANDNCDFTHWCHICGTCLVHCEDPDAHEVWGPDPEEATGKDEVVSRRVKRAYNLEKSFERRGREKRWTIIRGNLFATYILYPRWIRDKRLKKSMRRLRDAIPRTILGVLKERLRDDHTPTDYHDYVQVVGLPDFVVLRRNDGSVPFWVEVKYKTTKLARTQRHMHRDLQGMGFEVIVWRGGKLPYTR